METTRWIATLLNQLRSRLDDDPFWREQLDRVADSDSTTAVHLAVFVEPYLQLVLEGKKSVESRFSANRCAPYGAVRKRDVVLLKRSGGPVVGICRLGEVWFYDLDPSTWQTIRGGFGQQLCISDPSFWASKKGASYASLMRVEHAREIEPLVASKRDRRGWVVLREHNEQRELLETSSLGLSPAT